MKNERVCAKGIEAKYRYYERMERPATFKEFVGIVLTGLMFGVILFLPAILMKVAEVAK